MPSKRQSPLARLEVAFWRAKRAIVTGMDPFKYVDLRKHRKMTGLTEADAPHAVMVAKSVLSNAKATVRDVNRHLARLQAAIGKCEEKRSRKAA